MLAWLMAGADHHDVDFIAGSLTNAVKSFLTVGSSFRLASSLPWRPFLQGWDMSNSDVMKWLMHIAQGSCSGFAGYGIPQLVDGPVLFRPTSWSPVWCVLVVRVCVVWVRFVGVRGWVCSL